MSNFDERLEGIENRLEILLERQRLSRFDNLMFLVYPLVIVSITISLTMYSQQEALKSIQLWGWPLLTLLGLVRALVAGLSVGFVTFLLAYAFDSLDLRLLSVLEMALTTLIPFGSAFVLVALFRIFGGVIDLSTNSSIVALSPFLFSALTLLFAGAFRIVNRVESWFKKIMQTSLKEHTVALSRTLTFPWVSLIVKASWSAGSLMCLMILIIAAWRGQLGGKSVYDVLCVLSFLVATEAIMLYSSYISHAVGQAIRKPKKVG